MSNTGGKFENEIEKILQENNLIRHGKRIAPPATNDEYIFRDLCEICYYKQPVGMSYDFLQVALSDDEELKKTYVKMNETEVAGSVDFIIAIEGCSRALSSYFPYCVEDGINRIRIEAKTQEESGSTKDKIERSLQVLRFCPEGNAILVVGGAIYDNPKYLKRYQSHLNSEHFEFCTIDGRRRLIDGNYLPKNSPEKGTVLVLNREQFRTMLKEISPRYFDKESIAKVH